MTQKGQDSRLTAYDGQSCTVLSRQDENIYDFEDVGTMWNIKMQDGEEIQAFLDEIIENS